VSSSRPHAKGLLVSFEAIETRDDAEQLRGSLLFVGSDEVPPPDEGSWWEGELVGMTVVDEGGAELGEVTAIVTSPQQDLWEVTTPTGVVQVPAVDDIVKSVDTSRRVVVLDPPAGLFE
jgi:16S rRNA processing protein RimM